MLSWTKWFITVVGCVNSQNVFKKDIKQFNMREEKDTIDILFLVSTLLNLFGFLLGHSIQVQYTKDRNDSFISLIGSS